MAEEDDIHNFDDMMFDPDTTTTTNTTYGMDPSSVSNVKSVK